MNTQELLASERAQTVRRTARRLLLALASRGSAKPGIRVLAYHLMPPPDEFRSHMAAIRSRAEIIDEATMLDLIAGPQPSTNGKSRVVISFDDGYLDNVNDESLSLTRELDIRPLIFVVAAAVKPSLGTPQRLVKDANGELLPAQLGGRASQRGRRRMVDRLAYVHPLGLLGRRRHRLRTGDPPVEADPRGRGRHEGADLRLPLGPAGERE